MNAIFTLQTLGLQMRIWGNIISLIIIFHITTLAEPSLKRYDGERQLGFGKRIGQKPRVI